MTKEIMTGAGHCNRCGGGYILHSGTCLHCADTGVVLDDTRWIDGYMVKRVHICPINRERPAVSYTAYQRLSTIMPGECSTITSYTPDGGPVVWYGDITTRRHEEITLPVGAERSAAFDRARAADNAQAVELINRAYPETAGRIPGKWHCEIISFTPDEIRATMTSGTGRE